MTFILGRHLNMLDAIGMGIAASAWARGLIWQGLATILVASVISVILEEIWEHKTP